MGAATSQRILASLTAIPALALGALGAGCGGDPPEARRAAESAASEPAEAAIAGSKAAGRARNSPPRVQSVRFEPERPSAGQDLRAVVEASDPDGDPLWIEYRWQHEGERLPTDTPRISLRGASRGDRIELTVRARDGKSSSEPWRERLRVANAPPRLGRIRVEPGDGISAGTSIVVRPEAHDSDGDALTFRYAWKVNGRPLREQGPVLDTRSLERGDRVTVAVWAADAEQESEPTELPPLSIVNAPPRILPGSGDLRGAGDAFYVVRAEDPDGDPDLQFELEDPPQGMSIDPLSGAISWQAAPEQSGTHQVAVIVDDLHGGRTRRTIQVTVGSQEPLPASLP